MKNLTILKKKNISDKYLSFLFLINKINYKRLKSLTKRSLIPHYVFYKFLLKALRLNFIQHWYRSFAQFNNKASLMLPSLFVEKRMFYKHIQLLSVYGDTANNSYSWYNRSTINILKKNTHFNKITMIPTIGGQNILTSPLNGFTPTEGNKVLFKNITSPVTLNFNTYMFFNIALMSVVETYKIIILL